MKQIIHALTLFLFLTTSCYAQDVFWFEDFDNAAVTRWDVTGNHPTPAGIPGLVYGVNNNFDYFTINAANTPELDGPIATGLAISAQGQFVRGHHYDCAAPNNLPNPYVNTGVVNNSLHITAQTGCAGLIYFGTPGFDDWNCITISGNDSPLTQTEQFAAYNSNIDATGKCNIKLTADFFLGGSANGLEAHSTILYSIDGGVSWKIVQDNLATCFHTFAGTCNDWHRRSFQLPSDADNQPDLRIAFRWTEDGNTNNNTQDYALGASFNVDNVMLSACSKPNVDFSSQSGTNLCKGQTAIFNSYVNTNNGIYLNCFTALTDNCSITGYNWTITPASFSYVDGTSATDANPHVQFSANGVYSVEVTVSTCGGDSTVTKTNLITVADCPPTANFTASNSLACALPTTGQDTIDFTDVSSTFAAPITSWSWSFTPATVTFVGGTNAASQHPRVIFDAAGPYQVSLQVTTAEGVDTEVKTAFVEAISCECGGGVGGPTNLYFNDFTAGAGAFTLNSVEPALGTTAGNENYWGVNNLYLGSFFGTTPNRGGGNYLHIISNTACTFFFGPECQSVFNATASGQRSFAKTPVINAAGATGVSISFWTLNASTGANGRAFVYYSIDGGANWIQIATYNSLPNWTFQSITNPAFDNQANLRFGFMFDEGLATTGVLDPAFALDEISVDAAGAAALPNTWEGVTSTNWNTASNWSAGTVPTNTDDVLVPTPADLVGTFMPTIGAAAVARNVCNYGTITLTGNNTLTIDEDLLNEGVVTTDNVNPAADVVFANAASIYKGKGTMFDVDVAVASSDLTLENNLTTRSLLINTTGTVNLAGFVLAINKNLTKTDGIFTTVNGEIHFIDACGTCVDLTSNADVSLNANQSFGNVFVSKPTGVKTSLLSAVNHTFTAPKTLTIQSGILDANANTLNGTGNLTMTGGELQLAKNATALPELTGTYTLTAGRITLDGGAQIIKSVGDISTNYYELEFAGTGIKSFSSNNVNVNSQLVLNLPTTLGNYVNTDVDTLYVFNASSSAITRTGGHIVGYLGRHVNPSDIYRYDVGSDNAGGDTYYEPITVTTNSLVNTTNIVAKFFDNAPNPTTVNNVTFTTLSGAVDTVKQVETEGFWHLHQNKRLMGGNYQASVNPSPFWTLSKPWAQGYYALLKQGAVAQPWDFTNGGVRVNDSTTTAFSNFSNLALAFSDSIVVDLALSVKLVRFEGVKTNSGNLLSWDTEEELDSDYFELQRSADAINFVPIARINAAGESQTLQQYEHLDRSPKNGWNYYRLKQIDTDNSVVYSNIVALDNYVEQVGLVLMPNPARDKVTFDYIGANSDEDLVVEIFDVNGRRLFVQNYAPNAERVIETISTADLVPALYFMRFTNGKVQRSVKLLITE